MKTAWIFSQVKRNLPFIIISIILYVVLLLIGREWYFSLLALAVLLFIVLMSNGTFRKVNMINSNSQIRIGNVARFSSVGSTDTDGETDCLDLAMYESKNIVKSILVGTNEVRRLNLNYNTGQYCLL